MTNASGLSILLGAACMTLFATVALAAGEKSSAGSTLPVGLARVDITPQGPIRMSGYLVRKTECEGVAQRLWARALAIGGDTEPPAVLIAVDLIGVSEAITGELARRLKAKAGIERAQVALCATHTHSAPQLDGVLDMIFSERIPPEPQARIRQYTRRLLDLLEQAALEALADRRPRRVAWTQGTVGFAANRRPVKGAAAVKDGPKPKGPADHALPMLRVSEPDGRLRALLLGYACHGTTFGSDMKQVHGDWPGTAAEMIETAYPGATVLVVLGCGADSNPQPRTKPENVLQHGRAVADEVQRLLAGKFQPISEPPTCRLRRLELTFDQIPDRQEWQRRMGAGKLDAYHAQVMLERLDRDGTLPKTLPYSVQTWTFGPQLAMVFLPGEVVVDYALRMKRDFAGERLWPVAYANDLPCYIPSKRILDEGGYEAESSMWYYGHPTRLLPAVEDKIVQTVGELLPAAYHRGP